MYRIITVDKKCMVIESEFYHDFRRAPHHSDVAARNGEHRSGRTMNQASSSGLMNMSNCQCIYSATSP